MNISALPDDILEMIPDRKYANTRIQGAGEEEMKNRPKEVAKLGEMAMTQRAWPLTHEDDGKLAKLPMTFIQVCQFDPLRDEGLLYFNRLRSLKVPASLSFLENAIHAEPLIPHITGGPTSKASVKGFNDVVKFIKEKL